LPVADFVTVISSAVSVYKRPNLSAQ